MGNKSFQAGNNVNHADVPDDVINMITASWNQKYMIDSIITKNGTFQRDSAPSQLEFEHDGIKMLGEVYDTVAVTLKTFNDFREQVYNIVKALKEKINDITNQMDLACPQ